MAKTNGLNCRLYVEGYDLSGDANALSGLGYTNELLDITALDVSARKRIVGSVDTEMSFDAWFDNAANKQHAVWTSNSGKLPTADQEVLIPMGASVGDQCICLVAKQGTYSTTRSTGSAISANATFTANGSAAEYGVMLTAHDDTVASAATGTAVDNSASSANGGAGYIQSFSLASGTAVCKIQHSADNSTYTDLVTFTSVTGVTAERVEVTGTVNRYIKYSISGTFSNLSMAMAFSRS